MSNGVLSQAISNIQQTQATLQAFTGLPQNAVSIQHDMAEAITGLLPDIIQMQQRVLAFGQRLEAQLQQLLANLGGTSAQSLQAFIRQVQDEMTSTHALIRQSLTASRDANNRVVQDNIALQRIGVQLQATIAGLQSNLEGARQQLDELNKKKRYLLSLRLLGLPGLIAMAVLLSQAQGKVNSLESEVSKLEAQIRRQQGFFSQTTAFSHDFGTLIDRITKVGNAISFLSSGIDNVSHDVGKGEPQQAQLFFTATLMEVKSLLTDAS